MRDGTFRYVPNAFRVRVEAGEPHAGTFWRRRFVVLGVSLATLVGAFWSLSDALTVQPINRTGGTGISGPGAGAAGGTSPAGNAAGRGHVATSGHVGSPARQRQGTGSRTAPAPGPSATAGGLGGVMGFCPRHALVLSLTANQSRFGPVQQPVFRLSVVSTQRAACSFDIGPGHLALVIMKGSARIWNSGDCVSGTGSQVTPLRRGVPATVSIAWDKNLSLPGCGGPVRAAPPARYTAYPVDGPLIGAPLRFWLTA
jgi:hypothetical protein